MTVEHRRVLKDKGLGGMRRTGAVGDEGKGRTVSGWWGARGKEGMEWEKLRPEAGVVGEEAVGS